jgi:pimeloyl-ACP methyl ester carboxylesterase
MAAKIKHLVLIIIMLVSCTKDEWSENTNNHFYLENDDAVMPVFVNGNTNSKVFLILLHGGPGYTSLEAYQNPESPFTELQSFYAVIYWEQRCSGASQGNCNYNNLSLDSYTEDLEKLIGLIKQKYSSDIRIFLLGHSWGGSLGIRYLSKENNQSNIAGWIEVDGGHNVPRISIMEREMVNKVGERQIALGSKVTVWQSYIDEANILDLTKTDDVFQMNRIARKSEELMAETDSVNGKISTLGLSEYFFSPLDFHAMHKNGERTVEALKEEITKLDLSENIKKIVIPTLMIWGRYDFRVPPEFAQEESENYGSLEKELIILEKSAHFTQWNEPDLFYITVKNFIEKHK